MTVHWKACATLIYYNNVITILFHILGRSLPLCFQESYSVMFAISKYTKPFFGEHLKSFVFLADQDYRGRKIYVVNPYMKETAYTSRFFPFSEEGDLNSFVVWFKPCTHRPDTFCPPPLSSSPLLQG